MLRTMKTIAATRTLTTTEAAVLALLALSGERSGYDLLKQTYPIARDVCLRRS